MPAWGIADIFFTRRSIFLICIVISTFWDTIPV